MQESLQSSVGQPPVVPLRSTILASPTLSIGYRRARLLTSFAALRSPQTCFRLPHCLGRFDPCGYPRPAAGQLAAAAAHCAAGVGVSLIPYQKTSHLLPYLCISVSAIGDFETFDDSLLWRNFASVVCECQCKASVVGQSLRPGEASRCEGGKSVSCGRQVGLRPCCPPCWGYYAPLCRRRRHRRAGQ